MAKTLFKGIKTVKQTGYNGVSVADRKGYIWFVRPDDATDGTVGDIYFGNRHYASVDEGGEAKVLAALQGFLGENDKTVKQYIDDIIESLDILSGITTDCVQETGKPIIAVCQTNGKVSAAAGTINAENVNFENEAGAWAQGETAPATVEGAISDLKGRCDSNIVSSPDGTIVVTKTNAGTNVDLHVKSGEKVLAVDANGDGVYTDIKIEKVTSGLSADVLAEYRLIATDGSQLGSSIEVKKDSALQGVTLANLDAEPADWPTGETYHDGQYLRFDYLNAEGGHDIVYLDVSEFLVEAEFKNGLQVNNGEVSVKVDTNSEKVVVAYDPTGNTTADVLTVSSSGVSVGNIQSAIDAAVENAVEGLYYSGVAFEGQAVVDVTQTDGLVEAILGDVNDEHVVAAYDFSGQTADTHLLSSGTTLHETLQSILDEIDDPLVIYSGDGIEVTPVLDANAYTLEAKLEASSSTTVAAGHIETKFNENGELYGLMYYEDGDPEE